MYALLRSLRTNRRLLLDLVGRDLKARYVGSTMGFFWSVIFPLLNLLVYMFVFSFVLKTRWGSQSNEETALVMLCGILVWSAFAETVSRSTNTLIENQNLIQKVVFPSEVLPVYLTLSALVNMLIGVVIALAAIAWYAWIAPVDVAQPELSTSVRQIGYGVALCALPVLMALQALFTLGLGLFFATLNLFVRDVYHLMGVGLSVWMFLTPIFYPAKAVEAAGLGWVLTINPMYWLIDSYRLVLMYDEWPRPPVMAAFAAVAVVVFCIGSAFFMRHKPRFPDLM